MVLTSSFDLLTSLYFWPPCFFTSIVFDLLASFCFGLFLVQSIHSTFDLSSIISLCCFWIFWPLVFTFTFGISDPETKWECRSCDGGGISSCKHCILIWTYQLCMVTYKHWFLLWAQPGVDFMHVGRGWWWWDWRRWEDWGAHWRRSVEGNVVF